MIFRLAEQALERKGGDTRYASSSWGLFNEDIRTQTTELIGSTQYNPTTQKIEGFTTEAQLYNHYNFYSAVFFVPYCIQGNTNFL